MLLKSSCKALSRIACHLLYAQGQIANSPLLSFRVALFQLYAVALLKIVACSVLLFSSCGLSQTISTKSYLSQAQ